MEANLLVIRFVICLHQITTAGSHGINLALRKTAEQSSKMYYKKSKAKYAVDGDFATCTQTSASTYQLTPASWKVDLGGQYRLGDIHMLNTKAIRLHDVTIHVSESSKQSSKVKNCVTQVGSAEPDWLKLSCKPSVIGRYVKITKPKNNYTDVLSLCEVEIYEATQPEKCHIMKTNGENGTMMVKSTLHCASVCGITTNCGDFDIIGKDGKQTRWKRRRLQLESEVSFIRMKQKNG